MTRSLRELPALLELLDGVYAVREYARGNSLSVTT